MTNLPERIDNAIDRTGDCWIWTKSRDKNGYGKTSITSDGVTRHVRAHRVLWELVNGPIPEGKMVCHRCDNPPCVNPDHLFLGDALSNMRDKIAKGRATYSIHEEHPMRKLDWPAVEAIRNKYLLGHSRQALAEEYGISAGHVWSIVMGKVWKDGA